MELQAKAPAPLSKEMDASLGWISLAQTVLAGSRPLQDWERQSLDEFTWAEFEA